MLEILIKDQTMECLNQISSGNINEIVFGTFC